LTGPLGSALSTRFGARPVAMAGGFLAGLGLFLGAFATHLTHLYLSVGVLAGALLLLAAISFNLVAAGALLRPLPVPDESPGLPRDRPGLVRLLRHGPFLRYALAFVLVGAGYYVPFVHGAAPATPLLRHLFAWATLTGLMSLLLPLGTSFGGLLTLALAYGFCAGAVVPLQFAGVAEVVGAGRLVHAIGLMQMFESFGSLLGAPLAGWLRDVTGNYTISFLAAGAFLLAGSLLILTLPGFSRTSRGAGGKEGGPTPTTDRPETPPIPP
ncbi:MOT13 protein, partial [Ciccaba nigrolineata]|nr:MOT13 protein [Ciccaba nigrolineata]